jgi:hypothetical protein
MPFIDIVNAIQDGNKIDAIEKINDHLYAKAADSMKSYKEILAKSFFASEEDDTENQIPQEGNPE